MSTVIWVILALATAYYLFRLVTTVLHDGQGDRPAPRSRADWSDVAHGLPSHRF